MKKKMKTILTEVNELVGGKSEPSKQRSAKHSKPAFTLIEMLVVIGIIAVLIAGSLGGYSAMTKSAERTKAQELVHNVTTALTVMYQKEGAWPKRLVTGMTAGVLDETVAYPLAKGGYLSLNRDDDAKRLIGFDRFGVVTPWAAQAIKKAGTGGGTGLMVSGGSSVAQHILRYAIDTDGDGITVIDNLGGIKVRATACVWCCDREGNVGTPNKAGRSKNGIFSFNADQIVQ